MAIDTAVQTAREDLASGKVSVQDLLATLESTEMAEPAKQAVRSQLQSLAGEDIPTPEAVSAVDQEPVSVLHLQESQTEELPTYFNQPQEQIQNYFASQATAARPLDTAQAQATASAAAVISNGGLSSEVPQVQQEIATNLETLGEDGTVQQAVNSVKEQMKSNVYSYVTRTLGSDYNPSEMLQVAQNTVRDIDTMPETGTLHVAASEALVGTDKEFLFEKAMAEVTLSLEMNELLNVTERQLDDSATLGDWVGLIADGFVWGANEKQFITETLKRQGIDSSSADYVFKSSSLDEQVKYMKEGTAQERKDKLLALINVVQNTEGLLGKNELFAASTLMRLREELEVQGAGANIAALEDVLDLPLVGAVTSLLNLKILGGAAKRSGITAAEQAALQKATADAAKALNPNMQSVQGDGKYVAGVRQDTGTLADAVSRVNPDALTAHLADSILKRDPNLGSVGLTETSLTERMMPTPFNQGNGISAQAVIPALSRSPYDNLNKSVQEQGVGALLDVDSKLRAVNLTAERLAKTSGGKLHLHRVEGVDASYVDEATQDVVFKPVFGAENNAGYTSAADVDEARSWLFQENVQILARPQGSTEPLRALSPEEWTVVRGADELGVNIEPLEFFLQPEMKHVFTAGDANPYPDKLWSSMPVLDYLMPWSSRIKGSLFNSVNAFVDKGFEIGNTFRQLAQKVNFLKNDQEQTQWTRLLMHGDQHGMEFTKADAKNFLGKMSDRVWDAYTATRTTFNTMWEYRNMSHYRSLFENQMRSLYDDAGEHLADSKGKVFVRPVTEAPEGVSVAWDLATKQRVVLTGDAIADVEKRGGVLARTSRLFNVAPDEAYSHVIVSNRKNIHELTPQVLNKRVGHVDLNYKPEDSFISGLFRPKNEGKGGTAYRAVSTRRVLVDGVPTDRESTEALFATVREANEWIAKQPNAADLVALETRETLGEVGVDTSGTLNRVPAHARGRGDRLQGPDGLADITSVEDTLARVYSEARALFSVAAVNVQKVAFIKRIKKHMADGRDVQWDDDFAVFKLKPETPRAVHEELRTLHNYIQSLDRGINGKVVTPFIERMRSFSESLRASESKAARGVGKGIRDLIEADVLKGLHVLNIGLFIAPRVLFQSVANASQTMFLFARDPVRFTTQTLPQGIAALIAISSRNAPHSKAVIKTMGKAFGMSGPEFEDYLDTMLRSGLLHSNAASDIMGAFADNVKVQAGRSHPLSARFYAGVPSKAANALLLPQGLAADLSKMMAYIHSTGLYRAANKGAPLNTLRAKQKILGDAQKLSFTQNRADQFAYQQNAFSLTFQFMQHVHKMFLETLVKPAVKGILNKDLGKEGESIYATTRMQSLVTVGMVFGAFGFDGPLGLLPGDDKVKEVLNDETVPPALRTLFLDGYLGLIHESVYGERVNVDARLSAIDFVSSTASFLVDDEGNVNLLGPTSHLLGSAANIVKMSSFVVQNAPQLSIEEMYDLMKQPVFRAVPALKDIQKARIVRNMGMYTTGNGRVVAEVQPGMWSSVLASFAPEKALASFEAMSMAKETEKDVKDFVSNVNLVVLDELSKVPKTELTSEMILDQIQTAYKLIEVAYNGEPNLQNQAKRTFHQYMIDPQGKFLPEYVDNLVQDLTSDQAIQKLKEVRSLYPANTETVNLYVQALEQIKQNSKVNTDVR